MNMITNEIKHCSCYRNGYCTLRGDVCKPFTMKCKQNKNSFKNTFISLTISQSNEPAKKVNRVTKDYNPEVDERYGNNNKITSITNDANNSRLYVFKGFLNLPKENTIDYYMWTKDIATGKQIKVLVAYSNKTKKYYISHTQLKWLHEKKIFPAVQFFDSDDGTESMSGFMFHSFSRLAMYGYSTGKNGLEEHERRKILMHIINTNAMSRSGIISHLQGLINMREKRTDADFTVAISNWEKDIIFVDEYRKG